MLSYDYVVGALLKPFPWLFSSYSSHLFSAWNFHLHIHPMRSLNGNLSPNMFKKLKKSQYQVCYPDSYCLNTHMLIVWRQKTIKINETHSSNPLRSWNMLKWARKSWKLRSQLWKNPIVFLWLEKLNVAFKFVSESSMYEISRKFLNRKFIVIQHPGAQKYSLSSRIEVPFDFIYLTERK